MLKREQIHIFKSVNGILEADDEVKSTVKIEVLQFKYSAASEQLGTSPTELDTVILLCVQGKY